MGAFRVVGGAPLFGKVRVGGSKNAALPVIFASMIAHGTSRIENLPDISDVALALEILKHLGASVEVFGDVTEINTEGLCYRSVPGHLVGALRASTYLLSTMLVRFGESEIYEFGGCNFSARPIDMHLFAIESHGGEISGNKITAKRLYPSEIAFSRRSVGATVNALILAAATRGRSVITGCALEPHIFTLIEFLRSMGAEITISGDTATVVGRELSPGTVRIGGDMIEAGSYLALSVMTGGDVRATGVDPAELDAFRAPFLAAGCEPSHLGGVSLVGKPREYVSITALPYPGFPTDLQPIAAPMLSFQGGRITDTVWRERLGYLAELRRFGISSRVVGGVGEVFPSEPHSAMATAPDLRGGMALLTAALAAEGVSVIRRGELLLRGYGDLVGKLTRLGAEISYDPEE